MDAARKNMDYSPVLNPNRPITPGVATETILCGEFREGRGYTNWRPRGTGDCLLILTLGGAGRLRVAGRDHDLGPGDAVLYAPGAAQDYATEGGAGRWHLRWAHFQPRAHWRPWLLWPELGPGVGRLRLHGRAEVAAAAALGRMLTASRLGGPGHEDLALNALEEALLWIFRLNSDESPGGGDPRVQRAVQRLATRFDEPFKLDALAAHCGLSPSRLSHLFRTQLGTTPQRLGEKLRLDSARQLLRRTNLSVGEIAREVGFADPLYFSRRFQRAFGHPPSALRSAD
jgi:AraC family transcriptional regulator of arabinose operon